MRIQEHIGKISWSFADKFQYLVYGLVTLVQIKYLEPRDYGLFQLLISLNSWIFVVSDAFALQNIIQFGVEPENRRRVNTMSMILHISISMGIALIVMLFGGQLAEAFNEPRYQLVAMTLPLLSLLMIPRTFCLKLLYRDMKFNKVFLVDFTFFLPMTIITIYYIFIKGSLSYTDMVVLYFIGAFVSSALSLLITGKRLQFGLKGDFRIWKMIKFSSPYMLYSSLHAMPKLLDIYILQSFFSTGIVGVYAAAKTLFRVFDEAGNAVFSLVYPAAVRSAGSGSKYELHALMTKAVSFMLIIFGISALFLELGFSKYLITLLLPYKYTEAVGFFNLLIIAALGIPFVTISLVITADGKPEKVLQFIIVGVISSFAAFYAIGIFQLKSLIPVGIIVYYFVCSVLFFIYLNRRYGFKFKHLFRAVPDTMSFIRARFINK